MNDLIFLQALPLDLLYIVTNYDPGVLFIYCKKDLLELNWSLLLKLNFHQDYKNSSLGGEDLMRVYIYNLWRRNRIICGASEFLIIDGDGSVLDFNLEEYDKNNCTLDKTRALDRKTFQKDIIQIAYGYDHIMILLVDGTLLCRGRNDCGQLGLRDSTYFYTFVKNDSLKNILQIACGGCHTLILLKDGTLWGCGNNEYGQLGYQCSGKKNFLTEIKTVKNIAQVACGHYHSFIKLDDGTIMSCGDNESGQLGHGNKVMATTFKKIKDVPQNIAGEIVCGNCNTFMLMNDGTLMNCGFGGSGTLGHGDYKDITTFTPIKNLPKNIVKIVPGFDHAICLLANGTVLTCGLNASSELGFTDYYNRNIFQEIKNLSGKVENIGTGAFSQYSIIRLSSGAVLRYGTSM